MPEEFPTLEVVASLGLLLLGARLVLRLAQRADAGATTREVTALLEREDVDEAFELLSSKENAYFRILHRTLREALRRRSAPLAERVADAFDAEYRRQADQVGARRVRDFVVLSLLGGATVFAGVSERVGSSWFLAACVASAVLLALGMGLQRAALRDARAERRGALSAAMALGRVEAGQGGERSGASWREACPACGARDVRPIDDPAAAEVSLGRLGDVRALAVCRACGVGTFRTDPEAEASSRDADASE